MTKLPCITERTPLPNRTAARFRPGDVVVIDGRQPTVGVVVEGPRAGLIRLQCAACPEFNFMARDSEVQHLTMWLLAERYFIDRREASRTDAA